MPTDPHRTVHYVTYDPKTGVIRRTGFTTESFVRLEDLCANTEAIMEGHAREGDHVDLSGDKPTIKSPPATDA